MITKIKNRYKEFKRDKAIRKIERERSTLSDFTNNAMCIFSSPRGGSTWLTEMLYEAGEFIVINEPFFQGKYRTDEHMPQFTDGRPYLNDLNYWYHHPIAKGNQSDHDIALFGNLFSGKYLDFKIAPYSSLDELQNYQQVLVKFCYGNLMMPWIVDQFNVKSILLTRHPCAVIASQLKVKGAFQHIETYPEFRLPSFSGSTYFEPYKSLLKKIKRPEENLAALWAITVGKMIQHPDNNKKWLSVKYEDLTSAPQKEIRKVLQFVNNFEWDINNIDFKKPSRSTLDHNLTKHFQDGTQLTKWKTILSKNQIANIEAVLKDFEVENYD